MLSFELKLQTDEPISSYSFGSITVFGKNGAITTSENNKFMLLMSLPDLLDGISGLLVSRGTDRFDFIGIDSSFGFSIVKNESLFLVQDRDGRIVDSVSHAELVSSCLLYICDYVSVQLLRLDKGEIIFHDLNSAVLEFKRDFA
jgi:hypothetical protein